jgi:hypothetical protein
VLVFTASSRLAPARLGRSVTAAGGRVCWR